MTRAQSTDATMATSNGCQLAMAVLSLVLEIYSQPGVTAMREFSLSPRSYILYFFSFPRVDPVPISAFVTTSFIFSSWALFINYYFTGSWLITLDFLVLVWYFFLHVEFFFFIFDCVFTLH